MASQHPPRFLHRPIALETLAKAAAIAVAAWLAGTSATATATAADPAANEARAPGDAKSPDETKPSGEAKSSDETKPSGEAKSSGDAKPSAEPEPYLKAFSDDGSRNRLMRITGAAGERIRGGTGDWSSIARHQYSKVSAWNCDQSLMFLLNRDVKPQFVFVDGRQFEPVDIEPPIRVREMRWHPTKADTMIVASGSEILTWNVRTGRTRILGGFPDMAVGFGPWEGNPSDNGRWIVVSFGEKPVQGIVPFDLEKRRAGEPIDHGFEEIDFATISPSGRYVLVNGILKAGEPDRTRVFDRDGKPVGEPWLEFGRPSHFDLTLDANGDDIAVGVSKSKPEEGSVISRRLKDGKVTRLTSAGYAVHTSARNIQARGRVLTSFAANAPSWGPYSDKLLSVSTSKMDDVTVVATFNARVDDYWDEPQPSASPDGRKAVFASNRASKQLGAYVVDVPNQPFDRAHSVKHCAADPGARKGS